MNLDKIENKEDLLILKKLASKRKYKSLLSFVMAIIFSINLKASATSTTTKEEGVIKDLNIERRIFKNMDIIVPSIISNINFNIENRPKTESLEIKEVTIEDKLNYILENYDITYEEFEVIVKIVLAETGGANYIDAYAVVNAAYNRIISERWNNYVCYLMGENEGSNIYAQFTCPGQFEVYTTGGYLKYKNIEEYEGYQAVIDFLYDVKEKGVMHYFASFYGWKSGSSSNYFIEGGNRYHDELEEDEQKELRLMTEDELQLIRSKE